MRRRGARRTRILAAGALLLAGLAPGIGLSGTGSASATADDGEVRFTVGMLNQVDSFNPFLGIESPSFEMWALMYDTLVGYRMDDMSPAPALAKSWESSEDGLTWTFHVRDGVNWSDGEPLTADDVAYTYDRVLDGGPEASTWGSYLTGVDEVTAPDPQTVELDMKRPNSSLPLLPIPIVPEHVWKDVSETDVKTYANEPEDGKPVVGSGPFRLVEGGAGGSTYKLEVNPDYWGGTPSIDEVVYRVYKSEDPLVQALKKGEVDFAENLSALQVKALDGTPGVAAHNGDSPGFDEIAFNTGAVDTETGKPMGDGNPALQDPLFRHALGYGLDLDEIIEKVYQGAGLPGSTIVPPAYEFHWDPGDEAFTFDQDKAGQLLDDAGYEVGSDGLRTMPDGSPLGTLRLYARSESQTSLGTLNFFKEWLADLGIKSEVTSLESSKLTNVILDGDFDAFQWGWFVEPDPSSMLSYMTCDQRGNWSDSWYCNKQYDALFEKQQTETDPDARVDQVKQMQQILYRDSPYLVTAYSTIGEAIRTDRFACLVGQPAPNGVWLFQYGAYNYVHMKPAAEAGDCDGDGAALQASAAEEEDDGSSSTAVIVGVAAVIAVVVGLGVVLGLRRRGTAADRE